MKNKYEIMCTLTPQQIIEHPELVKAMGCAGMNGVRLNTAHLHGVEQMEQVAQQLKALLPGVKLLIDTKGPEMRTTAFDGCASVMLIEGDEIRLKGTDTDSTSSAAELCINYPQFAEAVKAGDVILIDDGNIALRVQGVADGCVLAKVEKGGALGTRKGVTVQGVDVPLPAVSAHDREYIQYACASPLIDVVAHSFVRSADDVEAVLATMGEYRKPLIAKIENQQGLDNLEAIVAKADGVLIARGDLNASIGSERIPEAQAKIAEAGKAAGKPVYLATHILPSLMRGEHADAKDAEGIRVAVEQGIDVMLLTNETATGAHPLKSVEFLEKF